MLFLLGSSSPGKSRENPEPEGVSDEIKAEHSCAGDRTELLRIQVGFSSAVINCLHPKYDAPFAKLSFARPELLLSRRTDHQELRVQFASVGLSDLTGYPSTTPPADFDPAVQLFPREILNFLPDESPASAPAAIIEVFSFNKDDCCPLIPRAVHNTRSLVSVRIKEAQCTLIFELLISRQIPYIINVLAGALIPPSAPQKEEPQPHVEPSFTQIECCVQRLNAVLKPRECYENGYAILGEELRVGNSRTESKELPGVETSLLSVTLQKIVVSCGKQQIIDPFDLGISFESHSIPDQFKSQLAHSIIL